MLFDKVIWMYFTNPATRHTYDHHDLLLDEFYMQIKQTKYSLLIFILKDFADKLSERSKKCRMDLSQNMVLHFPLQM